MHKTALVTGTSRGIGWETAIALAAQGHSVIAVARTASALTKLEETYPDHIRAFPADLTQEREIRNLAKTVAGRNAPIDILINNAGALIKKPFEELTGNDWQRMLDINLLANVRLTKLLLPHLGSPASILNVSSMGGFQGSAKFPGLSAYSVAKGAVSILSECLAVELAERNIHVNALCLGAVQTEMLEETFPGFEAPVSPEDMGKYIANFALDDSTFYNGQIIPVSVNNPDS